MNQLPQDWMPPCHNLELNEGMWRSKQQTPLSYPEDGGDNCFAVEDGSYWFQHRMQCVKALLDRYQTEGPFYDIGGGNGQLVKHLQDNALPAVLLEPGPGAENARQRGVHHIIQATLGEAGFESESITAAGAFDVLEHIEDDLALLQDLRGLMPVGGKFFCTVPAWRSLWSDEDVIAGHFRRYRSAELASKLNQAGFRVEFCSHLFSWLPLPVFLLRTIPSRFKSRQDPADSRVEAVRQDHTLPGLIKPLVGRIHNWELARLRRLKSIPGGTSVLAVATAK